MTASSFDNATIVEEMLVALLHIVVCNMRPGRRRQYTGLPSFRKNIIAFPQELSEVKQLLMFWASVSQNDLVNVGPPSGVLGYAKRARILCVKPDGFDFQYATGTFEFIKIERVRQRLQMPWRSEDLRENFIALRRRIDRAKQHFEKDLRVRRNLLKRIFIFLTQRCEWRPGHGEETYVFQCFRHARRT